MNRRTALALVIGTTSLGPQANAPGFGSGPWVFLENSDGVAGNSGRPMVCGHWRSRIVVPVVSPKPRTLQLQHDTIVPSGCSLDEPARAAAFRREAHMLLFIGGRYIPKQAM